MFKDSQNRWVTVGLFEETARENKSFVRFTLDEAKELFIECGDMTGYTFSSQHLGGLQHWKALKDSPVLAPKIAEWEEELEVKKRAEALQRIEKEAQTGHFQANKFLADRGWEKRGAGRPSAEEKDKHLRKDEKLKNQVASFLRPVK